jgi:2-polyprenyl-3-methyl-5-hydroxy-6-metoxy-1,4-benzoquinol methylase
MFARPLLLDMLKERRMDSIGAAEMFGNSLLKNMHERLVVGREIAIMKKLLGNQGFSMLDIGCGTGWISNVWQKHGIHVVGLEPSETRAKIARDRHGLAIINLFLEEFQSEDKFDVVAMRHVVEHFADPLAMLKHAASYVREGGYIIVVVPNINCIGRYLFDTKWTWVLPLHCNFFNPKSLRCLIERAGFEVTRSYQTPSPLWYPESFLRLLPRSGGVRSKIYSRLSLLSLLPFAPIVGLGYLTRLSDNITVIAQKRPPAARHGNVAAV